METENMVSEDNHNRSEKSVEELTQKAAELYVEDKDFRSIPAAGNLLRFLMSK
jgi:hypothetical protein